MSVRDVDIVARIAETIRVHYAEPITLRGLATCVGRNPNYIGQLFRERMGVSVRTYLTHCRITHAADLVRRGDKIEGVAMCVGYRSKTNFYRQFKRHFGMTPEHFRHTTGSCAVAGGSGDDRATGGATAPAPHEADDATPAKHRQ
jgi:YesN/AraC family two-component response regulator